MLDLMGLKKLSSPVHRYRSAQCRPMVEVFAPIRDRTAPVPIGIGVLSYAAVSTYIIRIIRR